MSRPTFFHVTAVHGGQDGFFWGFAQTSLKPPRSHCRWTYDLLADRARLMSSEGRRYFTDPALETVALIAIRARIAEAQGRAA